MTKANASVAASPGSGSGLAVYQPGDGKSYQVFLVADPDGNVKNSLPTYVATITGGTSAANKVHCDLFNATGSGKTVVLRLLTISGVLSTAIAGAEPLAWDLIRTSSVSTGGSTLTEKGSTDTVSRLNSSDPALPAQITVNSASTGGATSSVFWQHNYVPQEETQGGAQMMPFQNVLVTEGLASKRFILHEGEGVKLVQVTSVGVGTFTITLLFTVA